MVPLNQALYLQPSLDRLRLAVLEQNRPGSVEGLLAHHFLKDEPQIAIDWQVACTQAWVDAEFKPTNLDHVAALGYHLWAHSPSPFAPKLLEGLDRIRERDAFKGQHLSLARNPTRLLGIVLGSVALGEAASEALAWCRGVLEKLEQRGEADFDPLVRYVFFRAMGTKSQIVFGSHTSLYELAFRDWVMRHQMHRNEPSLRQLQDDRGRILYETATDLRFESAPQAAFIWSSATSILFRALGDASLQARDVAAVLRNFEPAMKRWRWDDEGLQKPIRWEVRQEREVQDII